MTRHNNQNLFKKDNVYLQTQPYKPTKKYLIMAYKTKNKKRY